MRIGADRLIAVRELRPMPARDLRPIAARATWLATVALTLVGLLAWARADFAALPVSEAGAVGAIVGCTVLSLTYATVGLLLANRGRGHVVAWLFLAAGLGLATVLPSNVLVAAAHGVLRPVSSSTLAVAWWVSTVTLPAYVVLLTSTLLTFPTGRPIGRRWWLVPIAAVAGASLLAASVGLEPSGLTWYPSLANPLAIDGLEPLLGAARGLGAAVEAAAMLAAVASLVARFRAADATLQAQLRWVGSAATLAGVVALPAMAARYTTLVPPSAAEASMLAAIAGQTTIPLAAGIAILRHHLYDIEVVVDRSLVYLPLMGLLGGVYAGSVALGQRLFVGLTGDTSDVAVIVSSLLVAWVFTPLRRQLESIVDRHVKGGRNGTGEHVRPESLGTMEAEMRCLELRTRRLEAAFRCRPDLGLWTGRDAIPQPSAAQTASAPRANTWHARRFETSGRLVASGVAPGRTGA